MKKKDIEKLIFVALVILAALVVIFVTIAIYAPTKRSTASQRVDLDCVTKLKKNPLKECAR